MNKVLLFLWCFLCAQYASGQSRAVTSRIKIFASTTELGKLQQAGVDFDHGFYDSQEQSYINEFDALDLPKISAAGLRYEVLVPDVFAHTDSLNKLAAKNPVKGTSGIIQNKPQIQALRLNFTTTCQAHTTTINTPTGWTTGSRGGFYTLAELEAQIDNMVASYPGMVSKAVFGYTTENRPMWVVKISDFAATDEAEPEVLYTGMHHSREGVSLMNLIYYMRYLLANYNTDQNVRDLVNNRELFFIPVVNIDGFNFNTTAANWNAGINMRRKNMKETDGAAGISSPGTGSGGDGVDLNRNYPQWWGPNFANTTITGRTGSTGGVTDDTYRGPSAGSEIETQNMMNFVNSRFFKLALNYHAYGNWWIRAGGPDEVTYPVTAVSAANVAIFNSVASLLTKYNCYVYGNPKQTVYPVNGFTDDWLLLGSTKSPIYSYSPEVGTNTDGFWPPLARIEPIAKEMIFANLQAAYIAGSYAELTDLSNMNLSSTSGSFNFSVVRRGLTSGDVRVSITPVSGINSVGSAVVIPQASLSSFGSTFSGSINYTLPANIQPGTQVQFIWQLETGGIMMRETVTRIYNPAIVYNDNMDGSNFATNWQNVGTGSAWGFSAGSGVGGTAALSESPAANATSANSATHTVRLRSALNLTGATRIFLSYLVRYNSENCQDRMSVELSTNGVNGTYTALCGNNTIQENRGVLGGIPAYTGSTDGWVREVIDLSSHAGNNNVGLQFTFRSNSTNEEAYNRDGFRIDNLAITKANDVVLPVIFEKLQAIRRDDQVNLIWKSQIVGPFSHYIIERSANGSDFSEVARLTNPELFQWIDRQPMQGNNFYRVRAVNVGGDEKNSEVARVVFTPLSKTNGYPNPVIDDYTFTISSTSNAQVSLYLRSSNGMLMRQSFSTLKSGDNKIVVSFQNLPKQIYLLQVVNRNGVLIHQAKVIKQ